MTHIEDVSEQRAILFSTAVRFLPQMQTYKEVALDQIVAQIMFLLGKDQILSVRDIQNEFIRVSQGYPLHNTDLDLCLTRIAEPVRNQIPSVGSWTGYKLKPEIAEEIVRQQALADARITNVIELIFSENRAAARYREPFIVCIAAILSSVADINAKAIINLKEIADYPSIQKVFDRAKKTFGLTDNVLEQAIIEFFQSSDPSFAEVKWNLAQSYYVAKVLGLDGTGKRLTETIFKNATFYLDTNLVIAAIEPSDRRNAGVRALAKVCELYGIRLVTCEISIEEMDSWINHQTNMIRSGVIDQIPEGMLTKVKWLFLDNYREIRNQEVDLNKIADTLFESFTDSARVLRDFGVEIESDIWFENARNQPDVQRLARELQNIYSRKRGKSKAKETSLHDAMLLLWVNKIKAKASSTVILVTSDATLPTDLSDTDQTSPLTVTLDALLQWISPAIPSEIENKDFSLVFAEMVKSRLFPQERFFRPEDFAIFSDLHMQVQSLPVEDVEGCITYYKSQAPSLDPSTPRDREKIAYHINRFFADPNRKYNERLNELAHELADATQQITRLEEKHDFESKQATQALNNTIQTYQTEINELKRLIELRDQQDEQAALITTAKSKYRHMVVFFILLETIMILVLNQLYSGDNLLVKIVDNWEFLLVIGLSTTSVLSVFYINKAEWKALGWPYNRFLGK